MKVKVDFITNSSSANYILYITSLDRTKDLFIDSLKLFLEQYLISYGCRLKNKQEKDLKEYQESLKKLKKTAKNKRTPFTERTIEQFQETIEMLKDPEYYKKSLIRNVVSNIECLTQRRYVIREFTSMLNDEVKDCPHYLMVLMLEYLKGNGVKYGIEHLFLEIDDSR